MRAKTEYVIQEVNGKQVPKKIGMAPIQRDGVEYEFDVVADMDLENNFVVSKSRCKALSGAVIAKPGSEVADVLMRWLNEGGSPLPGEGSPQTGPSQVSREPKPATPAPGNGLELAKARFLEAAEPVISSDILHNAKKLTAVLSDLDPQLNKPVEKYTASDWETATEAIYFLDPVEA